MEWSFHNYPCLLRPGRQLAISLLDERRTGDGHWTDRTVNIVDVQVSSCDPCMEFELPVRSDSFGWRISWVLQSGCMSTTHGVLTQERPLMSSRLSISEDTWPIAWCLLMPNCFTYKQIKQSTFPHFSSVVNGMFACDSICSFHWHTLLRLKCHGRSSSCISWPGQITECPRFVVIRTVWTLLHLVAPLSNLLGLVFTLSCQNISFKSSLSLHFICLHSLEPVGAFCCEFEMFWAGHRHTYCWFLVLPRPYKAHSMFPSCPVCHIQDTASMVKFVLRARELRTTGRMVVHCRFVMH